MRMGGPRVKSASKLYGENTLSDRYPKDTTLKNLEVHVARKAAIVKNCQQKPGESLK